MIRTSGELISALQALPSNTPVTFLYEGRCCSSDEIAVLGLDEHGRLVIDVEGDDSPLS